MPDSMAPFVRLCEHGRRYCALCGTTAEPTALFTGEQWAEADRRIRANRAAGEKKTKKEEQ